MSETAMRVPARWTDDCQGKKDFDGSLVTLSTRYWPRGGGFFIIDNTGLHDSADIAPDMKPSAHATIYLGSCEDAFLDAAVKLAEMEVEADTEAGVKALVEAWAADQYGRIAAALRTAFPGAQ